METIPFMENWEFKDDDPYAQPLIVAPNGRIPRFTLRPGQVVREHNAPHSPVFIVVLKGKGMFSATDGSKLQLSPNFLFIYTARENHTIRALEEDLVFITILHGSPSANAPYDQ